MPLLCFVDASGLKYFRRLSMKLAQPTHRANAQSKSADPGEDPRLLLDRRLGWQAGLGDDLGSLQKHSGGDGRDECESGGDAENLGHGFNPSA